MRGATEGFVARPGSAVVIREPQYRFQKSVEVPAGATSVRVALAGTDFQPDTDYQVVATPGWDAGSVWVTKKDVRGLIVNFENAPAAATVLDVLVARGPWRRHPTQ